ncbi:MAG: cobalamin biosynthesis protein CbiM [Candidatus Omnitrophica bacterium]|nr:cobalamin biosynthesis protein CbiM [Candidatus Omnitrophota bacterium]
MHMADALISPAVGGTMWCASAGLIGYSARKLRQEGDDRKVPLMGVLGAFVFAAQMINFSIPGTGSSGHLGGGMLLAILLGPYAALLVMASILTVQALFFADGGLLALGCNIFNLGFIPCFLVYPLVYRSIAGRNQTKQRILVASLVAAILGLQLGAFSVVLETVASGISELPFGTFVLLMQPIHLAIGVVEGLATAAVVGFVWQARPEILGTIVSSRPKIKTATGRVAAVFLVSTAIIGGVLSWFASTAPDGLEWAMQRTSGKAELAASSNTHAALAVVQSKTAWLPDYDLPVADRPVAGTDARQPAWPSVSAGKSLSGLVGGGLTLIIILLFGWALSRRRVSWLEGDRHA